MWLWVLKLIEPLYQGFWMNRLGKQLKVMTGGFRSVEEIRDPGLP